MNERNYYRGADGTNPLDRSYRRNSEGVVETIGGDELQVLQLVWGRNEDTSRTKDFWLKLEEILSHCEEAMLAHGWDRKAGNGRDFPGDRTAAAFSELWYAGHIGFLCWNLLTHHRERAIDQVALGKVLRLGNLLAQAEFREAFKPATVRGLNQGKNLINQREMQNEKKKREATTRRSAVKKLLKETRLTGGAREDWLIKKLTEGGYGTFSSRTIRYDIKAVTG